MTVNIGFTPSQNPFVDARITQSNPGSSAVDSSGIVGQIANSTSNVLSYNGTQNKAQSISVVAKPLVNGADFYNAGFELRVLYIDSNNYVYILCEHNGTDANNFYIVTRVAGTETQIANYYGIADAALADGDTYKLDVSWSGANATFTLSKNGTSLGTAPTVNSFALTSGVSQFVLAKNGSPRSVQTNAIVITGDVSVPATLGTPTPSGTIGTSTTASIGATTDHSSAGGSPTNTLYVVRATTNIFSGVTAAQVKAGQNAAGNTTGVTATSAAVSTTTPSASQTGLTPSLLYYYAEVQEDAGGLSNVVTGSFTTAALAATVTSVTGNAADSVRTGGSATIVGTNFGSSQGSGGVTIGGAACSITSWSDTSIVVGIPSTLMFTATKTVTVTPNVGSAGSRSGVAYLPPSGYVFERITAVPVSSHSMAAGITGLAVGDEVYLNATATRSGGSETATVAFNAAGDGTVTVSGVTVDGDYVISGIQVRDATDGTDTSNGPKSITFDTTAPSGYSVNVVQTAVSNIDTYLIDTTISGAEVGATYNYSITSSGGGTPLTGSGTVAGSSQNVNGISIASLPNGTITFSVSLTDTNGNVGISVTDTVTKFTTATLSAATPSGSQGVTSSVSVGATTNTVAGTGYYVADTASLTGITASDIRNGKRPGGSVNATKSGSAAVATTALAAIIAGLTAGTWTVCWLQNNNSGAANGDSNIVSATFTITAATLSAGSPTGTIGSHNTVTPGFTTNTAGGTAVGVIDIPSKITSITAAQVKASQNNLSAAPIKVLPSMVPVNGANSFFLQTGMTPDTDYSVAIVQTVNGIDSLLTFSFKTAVAPAVVAPSGYSISFGQAVINNANKAAASVVFANAEVGAAYAVSIASAGGGTAVTRSGTVVSTGQTITGIDVSGLGDGALTATLTLTNGGGAGAVTTGTVSKRATLPTITLIGASPLTVAVGGTFSDPGASATDSLGANISSGIVATGSVNTAVIGPNTRIYNVTDQWGNSAAQVTRTINVADQTKPVITLIGANPMTVTRGSAFVDPGATALDNYDGDITSSISVTGSVDANTAATYQLTYNVSDAATNAATSIVRIVNVVDSGGPSIANGGDKIVRLVPPLASIAKTDPQIANWIALFTATSNGSQLTVINDCPDTLSIDHGPYSITFSAVDGLGQSGIRTVLLTVAVQNTDGGAITTLKLTNNAVSKFAGAVTRTQTVISITPGDGAKFPALIAGGGEWFPLVAVKANAQREIMRCTARANDLLTVSRAQEGTQAQQFVAGEIVELRLTAGALSSFMAELESDIAGHTLNTNNPHEVTVAQLADAGNAATRDTGTVDGTIPLFTAYGVSGSGIAGAAESKGLYDADGAPLGAVITVVGTIADCALHHWPIIDGATVTAITFDIFTYGTDTRRMQEATLIVSGAAPRIFKRIRFGTVWGAWNELMTFANENLVGQVSFFAARTPKAGWLAINNGTTQYSRVNFKRLWDHLQAENLVGSLAGTGNGTDTFTLWDDGSLFWRAHDVSNSYGTLFELRDDTVASHAHRTLIPQDEEGFSGGFPYNPTDWGSVGTDGDSGNWRAIQTDTAGGSETAPVHRNYLPCIKY